MLVGNRVSVVKNSFMGKLCFTPLSKKKKWKIVSLKRDNAVQNCK